MAAKCFVANADDAAVQRRWKTLQQSAVEPVSAMELLESDLKRKQPAKTPHEKQRITKSNIDEYEQCCVADFDGCPSRNAANSSSSPSCLLQNPLLSLPLGALTEIAGPAGAGKTQIALSMCADCAWEGGRAVYLGLGGSGRYYLHKLLRRLKGMLEWRVIGNETNFQQGRHSTNSLDFGNHGFVQECLNRIFVRWICNSDELFEMLQTSLPKLLRFHTNHDDNKSNISLVILDGVANLFRVQEDNNDAASKWYQNRALVFFQVSNLCKELSAVFQVPFLVINGATNRLDRGSDRPLLEPALGLAWSQCVNSSFFVERLPKSVGTANGQRTKTQQEQRLGQPHTTTTTESGTTRRIKVCYRRLRCLKAPHIPSLHHQDFYIDQRGVLSDGSRGWMVSSVAT
jgi:hypothetical protein